MALQENKYKSLVDLAAAQGVADLQVREQDGVLYIDGIAPSAAATLPMPDFSRATSTPFNWPV